MIKHRLMLVLGAVAMAWVSAAGVSGAETKTKPRPASSTSRVAASTRDTIYTTVLHPQGEAPLIVRTDRIGTQVLQNGIATLTGGAGGRAEHDQYVERMSQACRCKADPTRTTGAPAKRADLPRPPTATPKPVATPPPGSDRKDNISTGETRRVAGGGGDPRTEKPTTGGIAKGDTGADNGPPT